VVLQLTKRTKHSVDTLFLSCADCTTTFKLIVWISLQLGGIVEPNDGKCHIDDSGEYTESVKQVTRNIFHHLIGVTDTEFSQKMQQCNDYIISLPPLLVYFITVHNSIHLDSRDELRQRRAVSQRVIWQLNMFGIKAAFYDTDTGITSEIARVGRDVGEDPRKDVGVGVVECRLNQWVISRSMTS